MLRTENESPDKMIGEFADSVTKILAELDAKMKGLDSVGESDRTKSHKAYKMIRDWFYHNGGL